MQSDQACAQGALRLGHLPREQWEWSGARGGESLLQHRLRLDRFAFVHKRLAQANFGGDDGWMSGRVFPLTNLQRLA